MEANKNDLEVLKKFHEAFCPISLAYKELAYSPQYARRLILMRCTEEVNMFRVDGRIYVSRAFLKELSK